MRRTRPPRPTRAKILGKSFSYRYAPSWPGRKKDEVGESDPVRQVMWIAEGQALEAEQDTLLHEYVESACALLGIGGDDHDLIVRITTMVHQLIADNPALVAYVGRKR
jgi:hypothetical protein